MKIMNGEKLQAKHKAPDEGRTHKQVQAAFDVKYPAAEYNFKNMIMESGILVCKKVQ